MKIGSWLQRCVGLGVALLLAAQALSGAALAETLTVAPEVDVVPIQVLNEKTPNGTLELGLRVKSAKFESVATVLRYDNTKLELLNWEQTPQPTAIEETHNSWENACILTEAIGADAIGAKPTLAYKAGSYTYLLLAAESFAPIAVDGRVVTVRFRCVDDTGGDKMKALVKEEGALGRAGTVLAFAEPEKAYGVVSATLQCTAQSEAGRTVYADSFFLSGGGVDAAYTAPISAQWLDPKEGESAAASRGQGDCAATFLDWDGSILETAVLPVQQDATQKLKELMEDANQGLKAALEGKAGYTFDCWLDVSELEAMAEPPFTSNNTALSRETYKAVIIDGENLAEHLAYGEGTGAVFQAAYCAKKDETTQNGFDDEFCALQDRHKDTSYFFDMDNIVYDRYGSATSVDGKYSVTVPVNRSGMREGKLRGVERAVEPGARIMMKPKTARYPLFSFQPVENRDNATFEIVPTRDMEFLEFTLVETAGATSWAAANTRSGASVRLEMADVIAKGTAHYIIKHALLKIAGNPLSEWDTFVDEQAFKDVTNGIGVPDVAEAKAAIIRRLEEAAAAGNAEEALDVTLSAVSSADQTRAARTPEEDFLEDILNSLGGVVKCTIQTHDPKKPIAITALRYDAASGTQVKEELDLTGYLWTEQAEQDANKNGPYGAKPEYPWYGNGQGTGLYQQSLRLRLPNGIYQLTIEKGAHAPVVINNFQVEPYTTVGMRDLADWSGVEAFYLPCGDVNGDGRVQMDDLHVLTDIAKLSKPAPPGSELALYNLNGDNYVNMADIDILTSLENLGKSGALYLM